jgi:ABC-type branched-subunit amino acid transport system ATPase component/predicted MFS family arabinose efflux permease
VTAADGSLERIEVTQADRDHARSLLGLGDAHPEHSDHRPLREVLKATNVGWYVVLALGLLGLADTLQGYAFGVMAPEIARTLGITRSELAGLNAFKTLATAALTIPLVMTVQRNPRRALVSVVAAFVWAVFAMMTAFVTTLGGLALVLVMDGATSGARGTMHVPLLADSYPPQARVRVLSWYSGLGAAGNIIAPLAVAALGTWAGLTWRGVFVFTGAFTLVAAVCALWLRDPGFGHWDTQKLREEQGASANEQTSESDGPNLGFTEITQRLLLVPSIRRQLAGFMVLGVMAIPLGTFVTFLLDERWGIGPGGRGVIASLQAAVALVTLALFGRLGERMLRRDPASVVRLASMFIVISTVATSVAAISPVFILVVVLLVIGSAGLAMLSPALAALQMGLVPAEMRPHAIALGGLATGFGGLTGSLYLAGIDRRFGVAGAIVALAIPGLIAAAIVRSCGRTLEPDIDRMVTDVIEEARVRSARANGATLPLLAVRGIDAKYGDLQVLFDIDLTVEEGEVVALLGTNGSGKSTLLKVVSGLLLPSGGSVRLSGADITFVSAERRVGMGITQIPGGHAVFGPLTVIENLLAYADTLDLGSRSAPEIERCFEIFPALADRRHQQASTLSGGEQQMLALAKAAILRPRLLLIDELSLGLAPTVVGELLDRVGDLREAGSTIVLVEQSVNLALSVCERAYFLERGEVRFSGRGDDLLARDDLLRAVFLGEHE